MSVKYKGKEYKVNFKTSSMIDPKELLKTLAINYQKISNINDIIGLENLVDLQVLDLCYNKIIEIRGLESFSNLKVLKLNGNNITEIKGLENLFNLQELYLYYNKITEIKGLDNLSNLQDLYLTYNNITEIKGLNTLSNLQELYLSHNNITEIKGLNTLSNLQDLYLSYNNITEIKGLITLSNLRILDLSYNKIDEIRGMSNLNKLSQLRLLGNPIFKWAIKHFKIKSNGEVESIPELVKYCQLDEKEKDEVVQYKKDQQLKYDQTIQYIKNLPSIYYEIDFEELKTKTKMEINELKNVMEELILNKQIEAKISGSTILFAKSSSSMGKIKKSEEISSQLLERDGYNDARALIEDNRIVDKFFKVFLSYSTLDSDRFQITNIAKILKSYPEIKETLFWEADSGENIVEYMEKTLKKCNVFVLFCSKNSINSKAVTDEWQAAFQLRKKGLLKIIPVYEDEKYIPALLTPLLNVKFLKDNFIDFVLGLRKEILRE